jgi:murein DD-endopeptidase MepM/ murein hydrolase activator NlpD
VLALTVVGGLAACGSPAKSASQAPAGQTAPLASTSSAVSTPATSPPATSPSKTPVGTPGTFVFPVVGKVSYGHVHHDYPATDILTACGNEVRAATSGVILEVSRVDKWKRSVDAGATRGGLSVSIKGDDGLRYYGSHLEAIAKNIQVGLRVTAGEPLGKVGETGDASACHLHFGISPVCKGTGDWWIQRGVIWPWSYLDSWRSGGDKSPVAAIKAWQTTHGCPTKPLVDP